MNNVIESAYRVYRSIAGEAIPFWHHLPPETHERWQRIVAWFAAEGEQKSGQPVQAVTEEMYALFMQGAVIPLVWKDEPFKIAWEAVVRHLGILLDDGLESMEEAESMWPEWAAKKRACVAPAAESFAGVSDVPNAEGQERRVGRVAHERGKNQGVDTRARRAGKSR
jgi:hypothetical protein